MRCGDSTDTGGTSLSGLKSRAFQKLLGGGVLLAALLVAFASPALALAKPLDTVVNPLGATMNVFDYWIDSQNEDDSKWENKQVGWWQVSPADRGVNANHTLKFHRYDSDVNAA